MTVWRDMEKAFSQKKEHIQGLWGKKAPGSCEEQEGSQLLWTLSEERGVLSWWWKVDKAGIMQCLIGHGKYWARGWEYHMIHIPCGSTERWEFPFLRRETKYEDPYPFTLGKESMCDSAPSASSFWITGTQVGYNSFHALFSIRKAKA